MSNLRVDGREQTELIRHLRDAGITVDPKTKEIDPASLTGEYAKMLERIANRSGGVLTWSTVEQPEAKLARQRYLSSKTAEGFLARSSDLAGSIGSKRVLLSDREHAAKTISRMRAFRMEVGTLIRGLSARPHRAGEPEEQQLHRVLLGFARLKGAIEEAAQSLGRGSRRSALAHELSALAAAVDDYRAEWSKSFGKAHANGVAAKVASALAAKEEWRPEVFEAESALSTVGRHRTGRELMKKYFVGGIFSGELKPWVEGDDRYYVHNEAAICSVGCLDFAAARSLFERNLLEFADSASQIATHHNLAELYLHSGDFGRMEASARTALALAEKEQNLGATRDSLILLGTALLRAGENAHDVFHRALALDAESPATDIWGVMLADYLIGARRFEQADAHLGTNESPQVQAVVERARGDLAVAMGAIDEARVRYDTALELVRSLGGDCPYAAVEVENASAAFKRTHGGTRPSTDGIQT